MIDSSVKYNLTNPAFTEDIGEASMGKMLPMAPSSFAGGSFIPGVTGSMSGTKIQGTLNEDTFGPSRKEKDKSIIKKLLIGAAAIAGGFLCFKGGKKAWAGIKSLCSKIKAKFKK